MLYTIAYISTYTGTQDQLVENLTQISTSSKKNNPEYEITGVLFYHNKRFMQVLEGEKQNLDKLMIKLLKDRRHGQIIRIVDAQVKERGFAKWNMDTFKLDSDQQIDLELITQCTDLFQANPDITASHFVEMVRAILHYKQTSKFLII